MLNVIIATFSSSIIMFPVYAGVFNIDVTVNYILLLSEAQLMETPQVPNEATDTHYDYRTTDTVCNTYETHNIPISTL
jgi:hypothetical protein